MADSKLDSERQEEQMVFEREINAPPEQVYLALTNGSMLRDWLTDSAVAAPRTGGRLYMAWYTGYYATGEFRELEPGKRVVYTWIGRGDPAVSMVTFDLEPEGSERTRLRLEHSGLGQAGDWTETNEQIRAGWETGLDNLESMFKSGEDLRIIRRPMLGVVLADFDLEAARAAGVPVDHGVRLDSVVEGMGAHAAGLRKDDVIVGIEGHEVVDRNDLDPVITGHNAGDCLEVEFYRGPEKMKVPMTLSFRQLPDIPENSRALVESMRESYQNIEAELDRLFANVTEEQAGNKPGPKDWSAKEVLAHLILSERLWQTYITNIASSNEPLYDDPSGNPFIQVGEDLRYKGVLEAYPTLPELRDALRRSGKETLAMLAALPQEFDSRRGSLWRLAFNLVQGPTHFYGHLEQMQQALGMGP